MNIPSLPSDSLHKFAAFAGVALILGGFYLEDKWSEDFWAKQKEVENRRVELGEEIEADKLKKTPLTNQIQRLEKQGEVYGNALKEMQDAMSNRLKKTQDEIALLHKKEVTQNGKLTADEIEKAKTLRDEATTIGKNYFEAVEKLHAEVRGQSAKADEVLRNFYPLLADSRKLIAKISILKTDTQEVNSGHEVLREQRKVAYLSQILGLILSVFGFAKWMSVQRVQDILFDKEAKAKSEELDQKLKDQAKFAEERKILSP